MKGRFAKFEGKFGGWFIWRETLPALFGKVVYCVYAEEDVAEFGNEAPALAVKDTLDDAIFAIPNLEKLYPAT
jgi:hypothetical protein